MKKSVFFLLVFFVDLIAFSQQYPKAILAGDYPDPSIVRDDQDYYMTHSPFYYMPGFLIWHSRDLMDWEPVARVIPQYKGSAMAPDLIKHNGRFYLYYPAAGTNWVVWADDIKGPWSKPVDLKVSGIDPGHVVGEDGKRYLYVDKGYVIRLTDDGLGTVGERKKVYDGWEYPKGWETEGDDMYLESPKLTHKDGYYYMTSAEGGTAGPATSHMAVVARSKSVLGPWENSPYNPVVHTYSDTDNWWSKGHGTLVDDVNGNWWIVYHAYAKGYHTLGRQTLIEPVEWTSDGWYHTKKEGHPVVPAGGAGHGLELSDNFRGKGARPAMDILERICARSPDDKRQCTFRTGKGAKPCGWTQAAGDPDGQNL
ncbi:MAG: family 43 glycosylhydrolase [Breznakibacter sp.]